MTVFISGIVGDCEGSDDAEEVLVDDEEVVTVFDTIAIGGVTGSAIGGAIGGVTGSATGGAIEGVTGGATGDA